jgi:hypothetical protein
MSPGGLDSATCCAGLADGWLAETPDAGWVSAPHPLSTPTTAAPASAARTVRVLVMFPHFTHRV